MKKVIVLVILLSSLNSYSQVRLSSNDHRYVTEQAWELLKAEFPWYRYSEMNTGIGKITSGAPPIQTISRGTVIDGSYMEDCKEILYDFEWPCSYFTCTHFWNADISDLDEWNEPSISDCYYKNALQKAETYWNGNGGPTYLRLGPPSLPFYNNNGPVGLSPLFRT